MEKENLNGQESGIYSSDGSINKSMCSPRCAILTSAKSPTQM